MKQFHVKTFQSLHQGSGNGDGWLRKKSLSNFAGGGEGGRFCSLMCVGSIALALDIDGIVTALVACPNCNTSPRAAKVFVKQNN